MTWTLVYAKHALKEAEKLAAAGLKPKAQELLDLLADDPFHTRRRMKNRWATWLART